MSQKNRWKKEFLTIAAGQAISLIGSSAVQFALIWWLASGSSSPLILSLAGLLAYLPQVVLGPFAGVWVDRWKRKTVIISADLFMGVAALGFAAVFLFGTPPFWAACFVLGIRAVGNVFHAPAIQAAVPMLVPPEELVRANGWSQFLQSGAFMLGPVLGAAMYAVLPLPVILLTDFAGAVVASVTVAVVKIPDPDRNPGQKPHFFRELREGLAAFMGERKLLIVTAASALYIVFYSPLGSYYPLMTSGYFQATAWHASFVELIYAAGMMLGALFAGNLDQKIKNRFLLIHIAFLTLAAATALCGILPPTRTAFWIFAVLCMIIGACGSLYNIPFTAYLQATIPPEAQGRAFSLFGSLMSIAAPIGLAISGPIAEKIGIVSWFFAAGILLTIISLISAVLTLRETVKNK